MTKRLPATSLAALLFAVSLGVSWAYAQDGESLAAGPQAPEPAQADPPRGGTATDDAAKTGRVVELPTDETIEAPAPDSKFDPKATLTAAVNKLGYETFERQVSVEFVRRTWHWRAGVLSIYESARTYANIRLPLTGKVQDLSNYEGNRYVYFAAVVNDDDAFEQYGMEVLSQPLHENDARQYVMHELVLAFLPFYVQLTNAPLEYLGISTIQTFDPVSFDEEKGWVDYQPVTRTYDLVRAKMAAPYAGVTGDTVDLYFERSSGEIALVGAKDIYQGLTGPNRLLYETLEPQSVGGITLPKVVRAQIDASGYRLQHFELFDFSFHDQPVPRELLKRP